MTLAGGLKYIDVCSGISAPTMAWKSLGWKALCFAEIEPAPRAVLAHHYPDTPLRGDFTEIKGDEYGPVDLLVGGTPCQSFSIAGLRGGMGDSRGNLALEFARLADRTRARWLVWENVPGVLSIDGGRAFGSILGALAELGYGFAYRILDAQHFGVPQRRRRVFVVGYLGDWRRAAAVLFERHSLQGNPAPRRETGPSVAALTANGVGTCGADDNQGQAGHLLHCEQISRSLTACNTATGRLDPNEMEFVATSFTGGASECISLENCAHPITARHGDAGMVAFNITPSNSNKDFNARQSERAQALTAGGNRPSARGGDLIAFDTTQITSAANFSNPKAGDPCHPLASGAHPPAIAGSAVRRLTPTECERLQGFPDDFTLVPFRNRMMADGPRYKMLGNSMAVPVLRWIGERIALVDALSPLSPRARHSAELECQ